MTRKDRAMEARLRRVERVCRERGPALRWRNRGRFQVRQAMYLHQDQKIGFCVNSKAGGTTLSSHLFTLSGQDPSRIDRRRLHTRAERKYVPRDVVKNGNSDMVPVDKMTKYLKEKGIFMATFVRHPHDRFCPSHVMWVWGNLIGLLTYRLVSAFKHHGLRMGMPNPGRKPQSFNASFSVFVDHVLAEAKRFGCRRDFAPGCARVGGKWRPYYGTCAFCEVRYRAIGRVEDFNGDLAYVMSRAGLGTKFPPEKKGLRLNASGGDSDREEVRRYMSRLNDTQRRRLLELYEPDFALFGYNKHKYV